MKDSLDPRDYPNKKEFVKLLHDRIQTLTEELANAIRFSLCTSQITRELLETRLMALQYSNTPVEGVQGPETFLITVKEHEGAGGQYFLNGYYRKAGNKVQFVIVPPSGSRIDRVEIEDQILYGNGTGSGTFFFYMPGHDVLVKIFYKSLSNLDPNYALKWQGKVCLTNQFNFQLGWSKRVCVSSELFYTIRWTDRQCTLSEGTYSLEFSDKVCVAAVSAYQLQWNQKVCVGTPKNFYNLKFSDRTCVLQQNTYELRWQDRVCELDAQIVKKDTPDATDPRDPSAPFIDY